MSQGLKKKKSITKSVGSVSLPLLCSPAEHRMLSDGRRIISVRQEKGHNSGHCYCHRCDCELGGWYRFADSIGGQINEHCMPGGWRCGTA